MKEEVNYNLQESITIWQKNINGDGAPEPALVIEKVSTDCIAISQNGIYVTVNISDMNTLFKHCRSVAKQRHFDTNND